MEPEYFSCIEVISSKGIKHEFDKREIFAVTDSREAAHAACKQKGLHTCYHEQSYYDQDGNWKNGDGIYSSDDLEKYYAEKPRVIDDPWPSQAHNETDKKLRTFLTDHVNESPAEIVKLAKEVMKIELAPIAGGKSTWFL